MEEENQEAQANNSQTDLINAFSEITSSSKEEALFFLESHNFDLDSSVSTFFETSTAFERRRSRSQSPASSSPSRSRSPSPPPSLRLQQQQQPVNPSYNLRSRNSNRVDKKPSGSRTGGVRAISDLNRSGRDNDDDDTDSDSDEPQGYYTGGEKSGMLVQDPSKVNDIDALFNQARQSGAEERSMDQLQPSSSTRSFFRKRKTTFWRDSISYSSAT